jgi:adenylosuccinate synthase
MKHSCLINGYDSLNLTKLDILDALAEVKIAVKYLVDGKELRGFPGLFGSSSICRRELKVLGSGPGFAFKGRCAIRYPSGMAVFHFDCNQL